MAGGSGMNRRKFWVFPAAIVLVSATLAISFLNREHAAESTYRTAKVLKGDVKATVSSTGKLAPLNTVTIGSQVSGNIKAIYADFNSEVKKDQVIALIDPAIYEGQVNQARAQLLHARMQLQERKKETAAARAGVQNAEANLFSAGSTAKEAELNYSRLSSLESNKIVSASQLDSALARRDNARGNVKMAQAKVTTAKAQLEMAQASEKCAQALIREREAGLSLAEIKLGYCTIRSSIDGVVISRDVDVGQTVAATLQSPVLFTIAEDLAHMQLEVDVSEADVGQIRTGQAVEFTVDAFPERTFRASVRQVRNSATSIENVVTYKIIADVNNDRLPLRPGMTANVTVLVDTVADCLKIPNSALRFKPPGKINEAAPTEAIPIKERPFYKTSVEALGLDPHQSEEFLRIIQQAQKKLTAAYALPEESRDTEQAWRAFFVEVFTRLHKILREDQLQKFMAYRAQLKERREKRRSHGGRRAKVYVPGGEGPVAIPVLVGITDDSETQVLEGELKEGDRVIVGLVVAPDGGAKKTGSLFSNLFKRGS